MKRSIVYLILLAMLSAILIWFYFIKDSYEILPLTASNYQSDVFHEKWFDYEAKGKEFKVSLPLLPQVATQDLPDPKTGELKHYEMYVAQTNDGTIYMISLINFPKEMDETLKVATLKSMINGMLTAKPDNKLTSESKVSYVGQSALDFTIENESTTIHAREFFKGQTLYLLSLITKKDNTEKDHFEQFIQSFKLNESVK